MIKSLKELIEKEGFLVVYFDSPFFSDQKTKFANALNKNLENVIYPDYNKDPSKEIKSHILANKEVYLDSLKSFDMESGIDIILKDGDLHLVKNRGRINFKEFSTGTKNIINLLYYSFVLKDKQDMVLVIDVYLHTLLAAAIIDSLLPQFKMKTLFLTDRKSLIDYLEKSSYQIKKSKKKLLKIKTI
jgi:hypothetical protein